VGLNRWVTLHPLQAPVYAGFVRRDPPDPVTIKPLCPLQAAGVGGCSCYGPSNLSFYKEEEEININNKNKNRRSRAETTGSWVLFRPIPREHWAVADPAGFSPLGHWVTFGRDHGHPRVKNWAVDDQAGFYHWAHPARRLLEG
jgi:hypothetical protein